MYVNRKKDGESLDFEIGGSPFPDSDLRFLSILNTVHTPNASSQHLTSKFIGSASLWQ